MKTVHEDSTAADVSVISGIPLQMTDITSAASAITENAQKAKAFLVITPNIQHFLVARTNAKFLQILKDADFLLPDGWPVVLGMRLLDGYRGRRITGADLMMECLMHAADQGLRVGLMGGGPGVAVRAAERAKSMYPKLDVVGLTSPMFGCGDGDDDASKLLSSMPDLRLDLFFLCVGTPKSEFLAASALSRLNCGAVMCFGAAINFLSGDRERAPLLVQRLNLEWLYRLWQEPRRLLPRYLQAAPAFAKSLADEMFNRVRKH